MKNLLPALAAAILALGSCAPSPSVWSSSDSWYRSEAVTEDAADVFYVASTNVAYESGGSHIAILSESERRRYEKEFNYIRSMVGDSLNLFAPYYHQYTMDTIELSDEEFDGISGQVEVELCEAFDYYMENLNCGRPFVLAGASQGGLHILGLLKHMTDEQYSQMKAAYLIGYRLAAEDLRHPHIVAAKGESDTGVIVSFNSVTRPDAVWSHISAGAATCINPLNWRTDAAPATLNYHDDTAEVRVDTVANVLVVKGLNPSKYRFDYGGVPVPEGNLHHWDILFYKDALHKNILNRVYGK